MSTPHDPTPPSPSNPVESPAPAPTPRPRRLLHGRYLWTLLLGLILGLCGAAVVHRSMPVLYQVVGYIRVKPYLPAILTPTDQNGMLPRYDSFVELQMSLLQNQRVLDQASLNPQWQALGRNVPRWGTKIPADELSVEHAANTELIAVKFTDRDPHVAALAVKSILMAYATVSADVADDANRMQVLEDLRTSLVNQKRSLGDQILALANEFGSFESDESLSRYRLKLEQQNQLEFALQKVALDISIAKAMSGTAATSTQPLTTVPGTGPANNRPSLQELLAREAGIRDLLEQIRAETKTLGQKDLQIRKLKADQDAISKKLAEVSTRIDQLNLEATLSNRIIILSYGETPTAPLPNKRRPLTAAAFLLGLALGTALVALHARATRRTP